MLRFIFEDGDHFDYSGNEEKMKKQIKEINEDDVEGYEELVKFTKKIFDKGFTELADVPFDKPLVMIKQLPALLKLKSYKGKNCFLRKILKIIVSSIKLRVSLQN